MLERPSDDCKKYSFLSLFLLLVGLGTGHNHGKDTGRGLTGLGFHGLDAKDVLVNHFAIMIHDISY